MQYSVRSSSLATVPYSMKNLIACFQVVFCVRNKNLLDCCVIVQCKKNGNFPALNFIVLNLICHALMSAFNVPGTNFNKKQLRGKNHERYRTGPDQLYPRAFALRPNRALFVLAIFKSAIGEKMLALRLRTSAT